MVYADTARGFPFAAKLDTRGLEEYAGFDATYGTPQYRACIVKSSQHKKAARKFLNHIAQL